MNYIQLNVTIASDMYTLDKYCFFIPRFPRFQGSDTYLELPLTGRVQVGANVSSHIHSGVRSSDIQGEPSEHFWLALSLFQNCGCFRYKFLINRGNQRNRSPGLVSPKPIPQPLAVQNERTGKTYLGKRSQALLFDVPYELVPRKLETFLNVQFRYVNSNQKVSVFGSDIR